MAEWALFVSCEHGGNQIPPPFAPYFRGQEALLQSHRGWDPGALELTRDLETAFQLSAVMAEVSRLVVDLNRSAHHPKLISPCMPSLDTPGRAALLEAWYWPYRRQVEAGIDAHLARAHQVIHLSVHSFTPELAGHTRNADIGLLYDPKRNREKNFCRRWRDLLQEKDASLRVRMNYPYRGTSDGFTTALRRKYPQSAYLGIELEVNQAFPLGHEGAWRALRRVLIQALREALQSQGL